MVENIKLNLTHIEGFNHKRSKNIPDPVDMSALVTLPGFEFRGIPDSKFC